jgi:hypothetical protein
VSCEFQRQHRACCSTADDENWHFGRFHKIVLFFATDGCRFCLTLAPAVGQSQT